MDTEPVTVSDIAELTAWARRLSVTGLHDADPGEFAAFHAAKTDILARIRATLPDLPEDPK